MKPTYKYLSKKYGTDNIVGKTYEEVIREVIAENSLRLTSAVAKIDEKKYKRAAAKTKIDEKPVVIPKWEEIIPNKTHYIRKAAQSGKLITETLRTKLSGALRDSLMDADEQGINLIIQQGEKKGRINPKVIKAFEEKILDTFESYTKRARVKNKVEMPTNVHTIAVTEVRSAVSEVKKEYVKNLVEKNEGKIEVRKRWKHNPSLSKEMRPGHHAMNRRTVGFNESFFVPIFVKKGKGWIATGKFARMDHPHDPAADAGEVIGCNCDMDYIIVKSKS